MDDDTRREIDRLWVRIENIDREGTRGVLAIAERVSDLQRDVADLKTETVTWQGQHEQMHKEEARDRRSDRRWIVSSVIIPTLAVLVSAVGIILAYLYTLH